jgi:hypothetical protein
MKKKIVDFEEPLSNDKHELFCSEYVRLDIEDMISNKRARRIKAYRIVFPETYANTDGVCNSRAVNLLSRKPVRERIAALYEENGTSVESEFTWTRDKSEDLLVDIAYDSNAKTADRLKAVSELNKMRGIDAPKEVEVETKDDSVDAFFAKFKGMVESNG